MTVMSDEKQGRKEGKHKCSSKNHELKQRNFVEEICENLINKEFCPSCCSLTVNS